MKKRNGLLLLVFVALTGLYSCTKDKTVTAALIDCSSVNQAANTFNNNIYPNITDIYCANGGCHDQATAQKGVDLSTYASTVTAFKNNNVICSIKGAGCLLMPNTGRALADSLILQMECWQQNGYPQ